MNKVLAIFCLLLILVLGAASHATVQNPLIRACLVTNGSIHLAEISTPVADELLFCQYGNSSLLDSVSVLLWLDNTYSSALQAYENSTTANESACTLSGGHTVQAVDRDHGSFVICMFKDLSSIGLETLNAGRNAPANAALNKALGL